jgi:hypothetical protein
MTTTPDAAGPLDVTVSLEQMLADMEQAEFEKWWKTSGIECASYAEKMAAKKGWKARAAFRPPCRGVRHPNCDYLAPCGSICNKCGQAT